MLRKIYVDSLPDKPGVYFFLDNSYNILYIGKAKSLRNRVRSYSYRHYNHSKRTRKLMQIARHVGYILCGSELEALLLESRLIKEHLPEYNIMQRRFKHCPFIKITMNEKFPRIYISWDIEIDGAKYLGPFANREQAESTVDVLHRLFPIRWCDGDIKLSSRRKPCLKYDVKKCSGPCIGKISSNDYRKMINTIIALLSGKKDKIINGMVKDMMKASDLLNFEKACLLRDQINLIRESIFSRKYQINAVDNNNLIAIYPSKDNGYAEMFFIRNGGLVRHESISFCDVDLDQKISHYIENVFFLHNRKVNKSFSKFEIDAMNIISRWLYRHRNDQSCIFIKRKRNKAESISSATFDVIKVLNLLNANNESVPELDQKHS